MHYWVRATPSDFTAGSIPIPQPRSGHTTVLVGKSKLVVFGGLLNKKFLSDIAERQGGESTVSELQKRLDISVSLTRSALEIVDELEDTEFLELASELNGNRVSNNGQKQKEIQAVRDHWKTSNPRSIRLKDLQPLLHDYHRLVSRSLFTNAEADLQFDLLGKYSHRFYHLQNASKAA